MTLRTAIESISGWKSMTDAELLAAVQAITKTINRTGDKITTIVLSGATPSGISLTKTFTYTGDNITGIAYS